jgi:hypothetical protein
MSDSNTILSTLIGYLPVQATLFVLYYGNILFMPKWVAWFPTILYGSLITVVITFAVVAVFIGALTR